MVAPPIRFFSVSCAPRDKAKPPIPKAAMKAVTLTSRQASKMMQKPMKYSATLTTLSKMDTSASGLSFFLRALFTALMTRCVTQTVIRTIIKAITMRAAMSLPKKATMCFSHTSVALSTSTVKLMCFLLLQSRQ